MSFLLTEEQQAIQKTARDFVRERLPIDQLRRLRDDRDPDGFSRTDWKHLADLGLAGIFLPEELGGGGLGYAELGLIMEECGRTLAATPLLSTVVLGASAIRLGGSDELEREYIPAVCRGDRILAAALEEGTRFAPYAVATRAERSDNGFRLTGRKVFVLDGHIADAFVVAARTAGEPDDRSGISVFLVPGGADGISVTRTSMVDSRNVAHVALDGVNVAETNLLGHLDEGANIVDAILDAATVALAAEMLGSLQEAFDRTIAYLKERKQFGVPIGSFQALKHRAATMFCEIELTRSIVMDALRAIDAGRRDVPLAASVAKARASDTFVLVANEAVQMHGGIGVTDELDIGFFLKRARVAEMTFGTAAYHRDRFAKLRGY